MKFKKALKLLKQGECVKTPLNNIVKLDTERNCLTTFDGYYFADYVDIKDILSDDWQLPSEYELQCLKGDYDMEHTEPEPKKELTGIEFIRDIHKKHYLVNFNTGNYHNSYALHTFTLRFDELNKMTNASELVSVLADFIDNCGDCKDSHSLLKRTSENFWRGNL